MHFFKAKFNDIYIVLISMPTMSQVLQLLSMLYSDFLLYVKNNKKVHVECVCFG